MYNCEEKKAIELIKQYKNEIKDNDIKPVFILDTALNLMNKLKKENEEKDKQIDLMAEEIFYKLNTDKFEYGYSINEVKTNFEKLAKEKGE